MIHVLFVCLGNICRSPMAEAMFRDLVKREGLEGKIAVDSAGTGDWHVGQPPHKGTRQLLDEKRVSYEGMKARQLTTQDFKDFHYIIGMDSSNMENIGKMGTESSKAAFIRFLDLLPHIAKNDVPDPYFTGNFEEVYELVREGNLALLTKIKQDHHL
ncbi:MAG: low molecular weight protein-tyrosine-phosphatase [Bacillus sp. (in: firmicutes)]